MARNAIATQDSKYRQKKRHMDETEVHYREEARQPWLNDGSPLPYQSPIDLDVVHEDEIGRIVEVYGVIDNRRFDLKGNILPNPYYVAHSWNDEDHRSYRIEGMFGRADEAKKHLFDL